jgi:tetratricopeptide (TPR) repeat protein
VFHCTPIRGSPGRVLSCGADGYLRISDLQQEASTVIIAPFAGDGDDDPSYFNGGMAFSHQMLTSTTGLLCSERGLHHFDIRLSPRAQSKTSLIATHKNRPGASSMMQENPSCKACAVWSRSQSTETEPTMIFAAGSSELSPEYVDLLDLRMDGSRKNILQRYRPRMMRDSSNVSVSGLDVTRDGKELLVSYECDQVYSFPIFHDASSSAGPTLEEIDASHTKFAENEEEYIPEMASYGGHLNRFTFLKTAKYAGPRDDYVVTGSDSGKAWIYERKTGAVISLLGADSSACNGIVPHRTLPFFLTYGINSTAKLWRAAPYVDPTVKDDRASRSEASLMAPYLMSPLTKLWDGVHSTLLRIESEPTIMPDFVASSEEIARSGRFSSQSSNGLAEEKSPYIGNALLNVPTILRQNRYECYRAHHDGRNIPVEQPLTQFSQHVAIHRLRFQAERLGVKWNPAKPWAFDVPENLNVHPADLVPDNPSDWVLFDPQMIEEPWDPVNCFNVENYGDILRQNFPENGSFFDEGKTNAAAGVPWLSTELINTNNDRLRLDKWSKNDDSILQQLKLEFDLMSRKLLYETVALLKEAGNEAMKKGLVHAAARRYDKAIQYCAVAILRYREGMIGRLKHLSEGIHENSSSLPVNVVPAWSPLLRMLITSRLNLSLLLSKEFAQPNRAADQARHAIKLLYPFTRQEGKIVCFLTLDGLKKTEHVVNNDEPVQTFQEAKALQAKAYFRLGSAELDMGDYSAAIKSLESSLKCSIVTSPNTKPDSALMHRLKDARLKRKLQKKRDRKRFQRIMNHDEDEGEGKEHGPDDGSGRERSL